VTSCSKLRYKTVGIEVASRSAL